MIEPVIDYTQLSSAELLVIQAIVNGTFFHHNEIPSGTMDGVNTTFTLISAPNPTASLEVKLNGGYLKPGVGYTLLGVNITMIDPPQSGDELIGSYIVFPT